MKPPYKVTSSKTVYENPWISVREDAICRRDNSVGIFGIVTMLAGSTVLAFDKDMNVIVVQEYKHALEVETTELISGGIRPNESPEEAAKRELKEETGWSGGRWIYVGRLDPFTTVVNSPNHMFIALDLQGGESKLDHGEELRVVVIPYTEALQMVRNSEITHGASVALLWAAPSFIKGLSNREQF